MAALVTPTLINASKNGDIDKVFEDTVEIYIDFSNQNSRVDDVERNKHDQFLGARLFVSALRTGSNIVYFKSDLSLHKNFFRDQLITYDWLINQDVFDPYLVMQVISTTYHRFKNISQDCTLPVVIVYDEMQTILEVLGNNAFHHCKSFLPSYICNSSGANLLLQRDSLLVIPAHAGTLTDSLISFGLTSFRDFRLPLPPLNEDDVMKILEAKCKAEDNFNMEQLDHIWLKRYFLVTGLIPRHLNAAFTITKQKLTGKKISDQVVRDIITATDVDILTMTKKDFSVMYTDTEEHDRQLIFCVVSGTLLNQTDEWVAQMIHRGKLYFTAEGHVYLPHCFFSQLLLRYNDECLMLHNYIPLITDEVGCVQFERMCATLLGLRINGMFRSGKNICSLSELFPSSVVSGEHTVHSAVQLEHVEVVTLVDDMLTTIATEGIGLKYEHGRIPPNNIFSFVFIAKAKQKAFDAMLFLRNADKCMKDLVVFIQYKRLNNQHGERLAYNTQKMIPKKYKKKYFCYFVRHQSHTKTILENDTYNAKIALEESIAVDTPNLQPFYSLLFSNKN